MKIEVGKWYAVAFRYRIVDCLVIRKSWIPLCYVCMWGVRGLSGKNYELSGLIPIWKFLYEL